MNILVCFVEIITKGNTDQFLNLGKLKISLKSNIEKKNIFFFSFITPVHGFPKNVLYYIHYRVVGVYINTMKTTFLFKS